MQKKLDKQQAQDTDGKVPSKSESRGFPLKDESFAR